MLQGVYILMPLLVFQNMLPSHPGRAPFRSTKPGDVYHLRAWTEVRRWCAVAVGPWRNLERAFSLTSLLRAERAAQVKESEVAPSAASPPGRICFEDFCKRFRGSNTFQVERGWGREEKIWLKYQHGDFAAAASLRKGNTLPTSHDSMMQNILFSGQHNAITNSSNNDDNDKGIRRK